MLDFSYKKLVCAAVAAGMIMVSGQAMAKVAMKIGHGAAESTAMHAATLKF